MKNLAIKTLKDVDKDEWDRRLKTLALGGFHQSSINADYFERFFCYEPVYIVAEDSKGEVKGSLLLFKAPCSTKTIALLPFKRAFSVLFKKIGKMITWRLGPVAFDYEDYPFLLKEFLKYIESMQENNGMFNVRMATLPFYQLNDSALVASNNILKTMKYNTVHKATVFIDLSLTRETLWNSMKKGSRYDVTKAKNDGIRVSISEDPKDLSNYYSAYKQACFGNKIMPYPKEMLLYTLKNGGRFFVALHNNKPLAGALAMEFNGIVDQRFLWNSKYAVEKKLFAMHLLTWSMIEYYKNRGCRFLDLAGINPSDNKASKEEGIFRFKTRWGGKIVNYSEFNQSSCSVKEKIFDILKRNIKSCCRN